MGVLAVSGMVNKLVLFGASVVLFSNTIVGTQAGKYLGNHHHHCYDGAQSNYNIRTAHNTRTNANNPFSRLGAFAKRGDRTPITSQQNSSSNSIVLEVNSKQKRRSNKKERTTPSSSLQQEYESDLVPYEENESHTTPTQPSSQDVRASLGPIGRTVAAGVELGIVTASSFVSGGVLGYGVGGFMGLRKAVFPPNNSAEEMVRRTFAEEFKRRSGDWHRNSVQSARQWAKLSAAFSGFHALSRVVRGGREDKWNGIVGSAATGAFLNKQSGPQAMINGGLTYAGVTYLLDFVVGTGPVPPQQQQGQTQPAVTEADRDFAFEDTPVVE